MCFDKLEQLHVVLFHYLDIDHNYRSHPPTFRNHSREAIQIQIYHLYKDSSQPSHRFQNTKLVQMFSYCPPSNILGVKAAPSRKKHRFTIKLCMIGKDK